MEPLFMHTPLIGDLPSLAQLGFISLIAVTPGPFTLALASVGLRRGLAGGLSFLLGGTLAYAAIWMIAARFSSELSAMDASMLQATKYAGLCFVLWLAWKLMRGGSSGKEGEEERLVGFWAGMLLNVLNPKAWASGMVGPASLAELGGPIAPLGICVASIVLTLCGSWLVAGSLIRSRLDGGSGGVREAAAHDSGARFMPWLNRAAAVLLVGCFVPVL